MDCIDWIKRKVHPKIVLSFTLSHVILKVYEQTNKTKNILLSIKRTFFFKLYYFVFQRKRCRFGLPWGCINNNCIFGRTITLNCLSYKIEFRKVHLWKCGNVQSAHNKDLWVNKLFVSCLTQAMCLTITLTFKIVLSMFNLITATGLFPQQTDQVRISVDSLTHRIHFLLIMYVAFKRSKHMAAVIVKWV